tara:strand:+ start:576 stop:1535 length:960 start_codon:yes stop_codon:yes gene_type:complete
MAAAVTPALGAQGGSTTPVKAGPKRGVSLFCYAMELYYRKSLEDCLAHISDLGTPEQGYKMGLEILGTAHVEGYPNPTAAWVNNWHRMMETYNLQPVQFGIWSDTKLHGEGPTDFASNDEILARMIQDIRLAALLGFTHIRSRYGLMDNDGGLVPGWQEVYKAALPVAHDYNVRLVEEIHHPLGNPVVGHLIDFIERENPGEWFKINPDFMIFTTMNPPPEIVEAFGGRGYTPPPPDDPSKLIEIMPYVGGAIHAKFGDMTRECTFPDADYAALLNILKDHNWDGYLNSEYQGAGMFRGESVQQVRRHHVMMKRLLGEA